MGNFLKQLRPFDVVLLALFALLLCSGSYFSIGVPSGSSVIVSSGGCPTGFSEDTTVRGLYLTGAPSGATVGASLGTAIVGTTPPDLSYAPTGTISAVSAGTPAGANSACVTAKFTTNASGTAVCSPAFAPTFTGSALATHQHTFTGTANSTMRSTVAPPIYIKLCKKS